MQKLFTALPSDINTMKKQFEGVVVPMITPLTNEGKTDEQAAERIVNHLIDYGCHPFVLGTTGEAASVAKADRAALVLATAKATAGRKIVYAGISGNCFSEVVEEAKRFADLGADALVSTMPSYYPVDADQILHYFNKLADSVPLPLILYNIPATTHLSLPLDVVDQLSHHPNILGFKDSEKGEDRVMQSIALWKDRPDFSYLLGWALMSQRAVLAGADGIVPSTGNLTPGIYQLLLEAGRGGNTPLAALAQQKADRISEIYQKDKLLSRALPLLKVMMATYGLCTTEVLPPLMSLDDTTEKELMEELKRELGNLETLNTVIDEE
jgi:dihydrodipicolinate synthase/N-acetylneuraminate lyase